MTQKLADAVGSASPDPNVSLASAEPVPKPTISNKPPPGQTGPRGLQPRQTYSRVNTGAPPIPDAGASSQKSLEPRGLEFLPKLSEVTMPELTMTPKPSLNDMIKSAMEGTLARTDITAEAIRQLGGMPTTEKTAAAAAAAEGELPTAMLNKLADALDYAAEELLKGASIELPHADGGDISKPGGGPNALHVEASKSITAKNPMQPGHTGGKPPATGGVEHGANKHMPANMPATNASMHHGEQPVDPMGNKKHASIMERLTKLASGKPTSEAPAAPMIQAIRKIAAASMSKQAEDAINPAQISAGKADAPSGTAAGEAVPSRPADVSAQERLIDSNRAAIDYTKHDAKRDAVSDASRVFVNTPMKDPVLHMAFAHSGQAGVKTSSMQQSALSIAAARTLLSKVAADVEAAKAKKTKESTMGSPPPPGVPTPAFTQ